MDPVEDIKSRLDVVDVIQEYLPLKPAGTGSFKGLCPFHHEKTPSFYANRPRQSWHCFGCDQGGDTIAFVMRMEGMEFREALELLAQKAGVTLPAFDAERMTEKKRLYEVQDMASRWFRSMLLSSPDAEHARAYAMKRGIDHLTGDLWKIGYAPHSWSALTEAMKAKDVTEEELIKVGLVGKRESGSGVYDRFRDRLMFTICDVHGNIVGFTGRTFSLDKQEAKYVNTPETSLYKKSFVLYGLDQAKGEIKRQDMAVIVEGNMDVVSSHKASIRNVIASSGTALTQEQLMLLKRFTRNLAIAFDQDAAGNAATVRGLDLARALDFSIKIITLPPEAGKDPDEAVNKNPELWQQAIHDAQSIIDWMYQRAFRAQDTHTPEGKKQIARQLLPEFTRILDPVERDSWVTRLAKDLAVSEEALREAMRGVSGKTPSQIEKVAESPQPLSPVKTREDQLLERLLALLQLRPEMKSLATNILREYSLPQGTADDLSSYLAMFADREFEDRTSVALEQELIKTATRLREEFRAKERQRLEQDMREAERVGDHERIQTLLGQFNELNS